MRISGWKNTPNNSANIHWIYWPCWPSCQVASFPLVAKVKQQLNNATNQKPTCCASLLRSRKTLFDLWYRSCAVFLPAGNFHAGWWTEAFHQGWNASPAVSWYTLEGLTALANPERSVFSKLDLESWLPAWSELASATWSPWRMDFFGATAWLA